MIRGHDLSSSRLVLNGVSQGCVLRPLLLNTCTANVRKYLVSPMQTTSKFATRLGIVICIFANDTEVVAKWNKKWLIPLNTTKYTSGVHTSSIF